MKDLQCPIKDCTFIARAQGCSGCFLDLAPRPSSEVHGRHAYHTLDAHLEDHHVFDDVVTALALAIEAANAQ